MSDDSIPLEQTTDDAQQQEGETGGNDTPITPARSNSRIIYTSSVDEETTTGWKRNTEAMQQIRNNWIYESARKRKHEFIQQHQILCFVGTWNVNAKGKEGDDLQAWLQIGKGPPCDIVAVGFQEIVDLNAVNVAVDNKTQQKSSFWIQQLTQTLRRTGESYELVSTKSMVGLLICVFVKQRHVSRVQHVACHSVGVGVLGMGGNKGGVSIRIQFYDTTIAFVCTHLAAHRENVSGRNADSKNVILKSAFEIGEAAIRESIRSGSLLIWSLGTSSVTINDHDVVVWLGDLNYRIEESMDTQTVLHHCSEGGAGIAKLRQLDQLNIERKAGRAFHDYTEGSLNFIPTYKYQPGTDVFEQRPDKKLRAPAWCDRILWRIQNHDDVDGATQQQQQASATVRQLVYNRCETPNISDHKPVYTVLQMTINDVIRPKREALYEELLHVLDRYENQTLPTIGLDKVHVDFGSVRYGQSLTQSITISNTGSVVAQFRLLPKPDEQHVCKSWLNIYPMFGMVIPGTVAADATTSGTITQSSGSSITMNITLTIQKETAQVLNSGREVLEDILLLRLENGRDYYITVSATYARSCFGMSVDELVLYNDPIRSIPSDPIERTKLKSAAAAPSTASCIPKELWRLVDAIYEKGLSTPSLFFYQHDSNNSNVQQEIQDIRECLDTGAVFASVYCIHSYSAVLVEFLKSLIVPIITVHLFPSVDIDSQNIQMSSRRLLEELQPIQYNIFVYIISFFREVLTAQQRNNLSPAKLAQLCCRCMTASATPNVNNIQLIILHLLETQSI